MPSRKHPIPPLVPGLAQRALGALCALLAACTNADPGVDAGAPEASAVGYYPLVDGAKWTYVHKPASGEGDLSVCDAPDACWNETITLEETEYEAEADDAGSPGPSAAFQLEDDDNAPDMTSTVAILSRIGTMAVRLHKIDKKNGVPVEEVSYDPGFPRFDDAWLELEDGTIVDTEYARTSTDLTTSGDGAMRTDVRMQQYEVEAREDVTVPAGTFRNCLKVRRLRLASDVDAGGGVGTDEKEKRFWFCDGVGKVREDNLNTKGNQEVLLSCEIPGGRCPR